MSKKVFFLGAGFSKAIKNKYPLMGDLTAQVMARLEKESIREHAGELIPEIKNNIESLLTYLSTDFPWKNDTTKHANLALYSDIVKILSDIFLELAEDRLESSIGDDVIFKMITKIIDSESNYNFITLNYDILLENIFKYTYKKYKGVSISEEDLYTYPVAWIGARQPSNEGSWGTEKKPIKIPGILKLHGSANWFWAGVTPSDVIYYRNWNRNEKELMLEGLKPYIIPPVLDKNAFYNHIAIRSLWQQAEQLLKHADEIYIIGFSFPQTDLSVKYLFQSALRNSHPEIYVVNIESIGELKRNYHSVFKNKNIDYNYTGKPDVLEKFIRDIILE